MISTSYIKSILLNREKIQSFQKYPFSIPVVRTLHEMDFHPKITFLIGENGSGKSTLLEAIAISLGFNPEGGSKNFSFGTRNSQSILHQYIKVMRGIRKPKDGYFLRAESYFNVATEIEKLDAAYPIKQDIPPIALSYGDQPLHELSHGESFLALLCKRFSGEGLYLLDEPEAALSPQRQLSILARIHDLILADSQFVIATNSPIIMAYPDAWLYQCGKDGMKRIQFEETEHFQVTKNFLNNPERTLKILFKQ